MRETVELHEVRHECHARWRQEGQSPWGVRYVAVGQIDDGHRWYVDLLAQIHRPAHCYADEQAAYTAAKRIMDHYGGTWLPVPCYPTEEARGQPPTGAQS